MKIIHAFDYLLLIIVLSSLQTLAQWNPTNGPYGGKINCVASTGKRLLAGTNSGLFYSTNNGINWQLDSTYKLDEYLKAFYKLQVIDSIVIAGTNENFTPLISTDYGATWQINEQGRNSTTSIFEVKGNLISYVDPPNHVSIDSLSNNFGRYIIAGYTFFYTEKEQPIFNCLTFSGNCLLVGTSEGLFFTPDTGKTWIKSDSIITGKNVTVLKSNDKYAFAGTDSNGVFRSDDNGKSWAQVNSGLTTLSMKAFAIKGDNIYAGTKGGGIFISTDNGENWKAMNTGLNNFNVNSLAFHGDELLAGTDGSGVFIFNNSWLPINEGIAATEITSFIKKDNKIYAGIRGGGVFLSTDEGNNWAEKISGLKNLDVQAFTVKGNNIFAGTNGGGIYRSENDGTTWQAVNSGIYQKHISCLTANDNYLFAGTNLPPNAPALTISYIPWPDSVVIYRSSDDGNNWSAVLDTGMMLVPFIYALDNNIYSARWYRLLRSSDNGESWDLSDSGLAFKDYLTTIQLPAYTFAANGKKLFAGTYKGIYASTNMGMSWSHISNQFQYVRELIVNKNNIYASTDNGFNPSGIFISSDNGNSWTIIDDTTYKYPVSGIYAPEINALIVNDKYLFIGTKGKGVWKYPIENLVSVQEKNSKQPNEYKLSQNYPNPFNPSTTITYSLPKRSFVTLKIYDLLGRELTTLVNEEKPGGTYKVTWNAQNIPSSVYFYKITAGGYSKVNKMILLK
jgi:photosystem II stability/assembly factor-like uncharacterized protein